MYAASSDERKKAALATSSGKPNLPIGVREKTFCLRSGSLSNALYDILVFIKPGAIQFTRTPNGESSTAIARVMPSTADFAAV